MNSTNKKLKKLFNSHIYNNRLDLDCYEIQLIGSGCFNIYYMDRSRGLFVDSLLKLRIDITNILFGNYTVLDDNHIKYDSNKIETALDRIYRSMKEKKNFNINSFNRTIKNDNILGTIFNRSNNSFDYNGYFICIDKLLSGQIIAEPHPTRMLYNSIDEYDTIRYNNHIFDFYNCDEKEKAYQICDFINSNLKNSSIDQLAEYYKLINGKSSDDGLNHISLEE